MSKIQIVDFYADWCGPCKMMAPAIESVTKETKGIELVKINVDDDAHYVSRMRVTSVPTIILIKDEQEIARSSGLMSKQKLLEFVQNNLNI